MLSGLFGASLVYIQKEEPNWWRPSSMLVGGVSVHRLGSVATKYIKGYGSHRLWVGGNRLRALHYSEVLRQNGIRIMAHFSTTRNRADFGSGLPPFHCILFWHHQRRQGRAGREKGKALEIAEIKSKYYSRSRYMIRKNIMGQ